MLCDCDLYSVFLSLSLRLCRQCLLEVCMYIIIVVCYLFLLVANKIHNAIILLDFEILHVAEKEMVPNTLIIMWSKQE